MLELAFSEGEIMSVGTQDDNYAGKIYPSAVSKFLIDRSTEEH